MSWTAVLLWAGIIFYLSSLSNFGLHPETDLVSLLAHTVEYALLTILLMRALTGEKLTARRAGWIAALLALAYAGSDEYHQSFVANRTPSALDFLIDAAAIGTVVIAAIAREQAD